MAAAEVEYPNCEAAEFRNSISILPIVSSANHISQPRIMPNRRKSSVQLCRDFLLWFSIMLQTRNVPLGVRLERGLPL